MKKNLEQTIREVSDLFYGSDKARDTYAKDTPGQTPGIEHDPVQHQHKPELAIDGVPEVGGMVKKPNLTATIKKEDLQYDLSEKEIGDILESVAEQMSPEQRKKAAAKIFQMHQDKKAAQALKKKSDPAAKAARRDAASYKTSDDSHLDKKPKAPEKKRGRGERDLPHIVAQMRSVVDNDKHPGVKFKDGTTKKVSQKQASAYLKKHDSAKPADKMNMYKAHDSHKSFMKHVGEAMKGMGDSSMTGMDPNDAPKPGEAAKDRKMARKMQQHDMKKGRDITKINYYSADARKRYQKKFGEGMMDDIKDKVKASPLNMNTLSRKRAQVKVDLKKRLNKMEAVDDKDKKGLEKLAKGLKGSSQAHLDQMKKLKKMISDGYIAEKSVPNNPKLWAAKKAAAKAKFDVYPSAYANGWAAKAYKKAGGTWRSESVEHDLNELSSKTLKNYIRKAASPVNKPSAINLASKGGYKLGKSDKYDLDAGEKEDRKAYNRGRGIQKAAKKLYSRTNESNDSMQRMADTWNDHADHPHPKVKKHIKAAEKAYNNQDHEGFYNHTQRAADHAYMLKQKKKTNEEKMAGQEYRTQMAKVKSKNPAIRKAISNIYDKKPGKDIDHPEVKAAKKYMKTEATYDQVLKHRYQSDSDHDNPQNRAYLGKVKSGPTKGMNAYKSIPGKSLDSKKGKMAAIKKQLKRRPADYGIDGKHDRLYPANQGDIQKKAARQKSKREAGKYMDQKKGENLAGRVKKG